VAYTRRSTKLRTIRLARDLDNLLQKDAKSKRISTNSLLTSIVVKYAEWDRYAEKFGLVSLTQAASRSILEAIDDYFPRNKNGAWFTKYEARFYK
jgi:hypothetical protein